MIWERVASAGHNDDGFFWGVSEELVHTDGRFFDGGAIGDTIRFAVVDESFFGLELVEAMEDGGRMADDEKFVFERSIDASNGGRDGELSVDKFDAGDGSF